MTHYNHRNLKFCVTLIILGYSLSPSCGTDAQS